MAPKFASTKSTKRIWYLVAILSLVIAIATFFPRFTSAYEPFTAGSNCTAKNADLVNALPGGFTKACGGCSVNRVNNNLVLSCACKDPATNTCMSTPIESNISIPGIELYKDTATNKYKLGQPPSASPVVSVATPVATTTNLSTASPSPSVPK